MQSTTETAELKRLAGRIERWRATRVKRWPMPSELWQQAAKLATKLGAYRTARGLRLNYDSLREHMGACSEGVGAGASERRSPEAEQRFVDVGALGDLMVSTRAAATAEAATVVEYRSREGEQLVIRLGPGQELDVVGLLRDFRGGHR